MSALDPPLEISKLKKNDKIIVSEEKINKIKTLKYLI
tara:strand:+ start:27 stop:137 length:111 start_codon:yes stop_codon:yes gene_type:complete